MTAADLGPENPLPSLGNLRTANTVEAGPGVPPEMKANMTYGMNPNPLPYTIQDGYSREKKKTTIKTIVLENDHLKATILPTYGGRLWSLYDKDEARDLIYENPVIQPANLAIRNAWLSGGVEWNIGLRGHSPFTCSDVFAARIDGDGYPVLRLYEYERIRQVPFSVDFLLPPDSRLLYVFVRIRNPHEEQVPMYWWSNIAFPEHPESRIVVPADKAFQFGYGKKGLALIDVPQVEGIDVSYTVNLKHSADFFFDIPPADRKWIAGIDRDGAGLFQSSTDTLLGRKLFVWGTGTGGNAWQSFLAEPGKPYIEIQAGLAHTQMEHLPMPAGADWKWLEAYGGVNVDPDPVHRGSWQDAYTAVGAEVEKILPREDMERMYGAASSSVDMGVEEILHAGSGWGFLENEYRKSTGAALLSGDDLDYGLVAGDAQKQWSSLLSNGDFPQPDPLAEPVGYEVEPKWRSLLEGYVEKKPGNWYAWLHLGLMRFAAEDLDGARDAWKKSLDGAPNPWAYRNLAQLAVLNDEIDTAIDDYASGYNLLKTCLPLTVEYGNALLQAEKGEKWLEVLDGLPSDWKGMGRFQLLYARGLLSVGRLDEAMAIIEKEPEVTDLREGENSLTDVWFQIHEKKILASEDVPEGDLREYVMENFPPPAQIDFRMRTKIPKE